MKPIKLIITVLSLCLVYQTTYAQKCNGNKVLMSKGTKGACGCNNCQSQCVDQSEVQAYTNMGWYLGPCINLGRFCCNWVRNSGEPGNEKTMLADIVADPGSRAYKISFLLASQIKVSLQVFDMTGRCVATVANKIFKENINEVTWKTEGVNPGMYFLKMNTDGYNVTRKIAVIN